MEPIPSRTNDVLFLKDGELDEMGRGRVGGAGKRKYAPAFSFRPFARLLYSGNEPPPTPDSSDAFFRRWLILPFERRFEGCRIERRILDRLTTPGELSGLLNHGIVALLALLSRGGFVSSAASVEAAERFRLDSDSVAGFLGECCELDSEQRVTRTGLFDAYRNWCSENNRKALGKQRFNRRSRRSTRP
jgi:putative DNA primase/helicase